MHTSVAESPASVGLLIHEVHFTLPGEGERIEGRREVTQVMGGDSYQ